MQEQTSHDVLGGDDDQFDESVFLATRNDAEAKIYYASPASAQIGGDLIGESAGAPTNLYYSDTSKQISVDLCTALKANHASSSLVTSGTTMSVLHFLARRRHSSPSSSSVGRDER